MEGIKARNRMPSEPTVVQLTMASTHNVFRPYLDSVAHAATGPCEDGAIIGVVADANVSTIGDIDADDGGKIGETIGCTVGRVGKNGQKQLEVLKM